MYRSIPDVYQFVTTRRSDYSKLERFSGIVNAMSPSFDAMYSGFDAIYRDFFAMYQGFRALYRSIPFVYQFGMTRSSDYSILEGFSWIVSAMSHSFVRSCRICTYPTLYWKGYCTVPFCSSKSCTVQYSYSYS